jgi:hypothetical protein
MTVISCTGHEYIMGAGEDEAPIPGAEEYIIKARRSGRGLCAMLWRHGPHDPKECILRGVWGVQRGAFASNNKPPSL